AIGDVHGCFAELLALERRIIADATGVAGEKWIVTLGDYIDRGPASAQVVDHLMAPPPADFRRICLLGNHEQMLLDFLAAPRANPYLLEYGGWETAQSYGLNTSAGINLTGLARDLRGRMPPEHLQWLEQLPIALSVPGYIFAHAGIRPGLTLDEQSDQDLLWIRQPFLDSLASQAGTIVVHGHTPVAEPEQTAARINVDTGCFATGRLTAVRIDAGGGVSFLFNR
ncbi:metallophosphoesterase family protein, partial [Devosia sp.]|uniref:metallophosphoesterase family protein n=1 Tax=Devosia sp. TaxID=1871048 RepID=UPI001AC55687